MSDKMDIDKTGDQAHAAGALDIRNIIGALMGIYGVILLVMGMVGDTSTGAPPPEGVSEINSNLWAGVVLLVVGVAFIVWAKVNPIAVPESNDQSDTSGSS